MSKSEEKKIDTKEAKEALAKEQSGRQQKCVREIEVALKKYDCRLNPFPQFTQDGRVGANVSIVASPTQ